MFIVKKLCSKDPDTRYTYARIRVMAGLRLNLYRGAWRDIPRATPVRDRDSSTSGILQTFDDYRLIIFVFLECEGSNRFTTLLTTRYVLRVRRHCSCLAGGHEFQDLLLANGALEQSRSLQRYC